MIFITRQLPVDGPVFVDLTNAKDGGKKTKSKGRCGQMLPDVDAESSLSNYKCQ